MKGSLHSLAPFPNMVSVNAKELSSKAAAPHRFGVQAIIHIHLPTPTAEASHQDR